MSKEREAFQQRTVEQTQPGSNPQPAPVFHTEQYDSRPPQTGAYPGLTYNTSAPGSATVVPGPVAAPVYPQIHGVVHAKKSLVDCYILWLILGLVGAHHFYLRVSQILLIIFVSFITFLIFILGV
jgi:hypothetical protein